MLTLLQNIALTILPWLFVLTLVVVVHELGHFLVAKACRVKVDRFSIGFGKTLFAWRDKSGVEWRLAALPLGGYVRFAGDAEASSSVPDAEDLADLKRQIVERQGPQAVEQYMHFKPLWQRALIVAAGPAANFILSIAIFSILLMSLGETFSVPRVTAVQPGSAAERAGFKPGDLITSMAGQPLDNFASVGRFATSKAGQPIAFMVQRNGAAVPITATPVSISLSNPLFGRHAMAIGRLGLEHIRAPGEPAFRRLNPIAAVAEGTRETGEILGVTLSYIGRIAAGRESGDQLGGPIRTALMSKSVTEAGAASGTTLAQKALGVTLGLITFAALISVSIGFMNLLPIPMLDGGHLLFYGYEAVARRPVTAKVQAVSYRVGLALVVGLMLFATWNDLQLPVLKILGGHVS